jgi:hydroxypyruvate isomerase
MPKFSANLSMLFTDVEFIKRFERAAKAGFKAVEVQFPYEKGKEEVAAELSKNKLEMVLHNTPAGNWAAGERGVAVMPNRVAEFKEGVAKAIDYAKALKCKRINCLVGLTPKDVPADKVRQTVVDNLRWAAGEMQKAGIFLLVEALSTAVPGFYLMTTKDSLNLIKDVNHPNLYVQYDIFHMQIMEGNLTKTIRDNIAKIKHIQLADNPGRNEPGTGEINFTNLFKFIDEAGYDGWIGCEYKPGGVTTEAGLGWMKPYMK